MDRTMRSQLRPVEEVAIVASEGRAAAGGGRREP